MQEESCDNMDKLNKPRNYLIPRPHFEIIEYQISRISFFSLLSKATRSPG